MNPGRSSACLCLLIAVALCAPPSAGAFEIAFQSNRDGDNDIFVVDSDGGPERALTENDTPDVTPSWSPDGTTIVYACAPDRSWDVCTIDPATELVTRLTRTSGADEFDPRYTSDGRHIVMETYRRGSNLADIAIVPVAGGVPRRLRTTRTVDDQDPAPEPGTTRIAQGADGNIVTFDTGSPGTVTRVTTSDRGASDPAFSSADEIAFVTLRGGSHDIFVAGPSSRRRLTSSTANDASPAWTPDATEILFARLPRTGSRGYRILAMDADGSDVRPVTDGGDYDDMQPAPQPDGELLERALRTPRALLVVGEPEARPQRAGPLAVAATHCNNVQHGGNSFPGTSGKDCYNGGGGNDNIRGREAKDVLEGGSGNDELFAADSAQDITVDGGSGNDSCDIDNKVDLYKNCAGY